MPHEIPPPETCHGVSGSHPNTHTNTCSSSPTPTHTCLAHAVCVQQEGTKATDAPLTLTSSQKEHFLPHPQTFICAEQASARHPVHQIPWLQPTFLSEHPILLPTACLQLGSHLRLHLADGPCRHTKSSLISRQTEDHQHNLVSFSFPFLRNLILNVVAFKVS